MSHAPEIALDLRGTPFQVSVWRALEAIEPGSTETYGQLATRLGRSKTIRAVAAAVGLNPVSILLGCHRVIGADGVVTG